MQNRLTLIVCLLALVPVLASCRRSNGEQLDDTVEVRQLSRFGEPEPETTHSRRLIRTQIASADYRLPHVPSEVLSDFYDCRGRRQHKGIDFLIPGDVFGLGLPIHAIGRSRVIRVGTPESDPQRFGRRLTHRGTVERGGRDLPTWGDVDGYGEVFFFSENYGSYHTGTLLVTELLDGPLAGHTVRYMHLAVVHPRVTEGDVLEPGQEIGLMGGTAILSSPPHVHMDIEDFDGRRVDFARFLGLGEDSEERGRCR